ncbi:MAG: T9SS type A sorting domain-containing protein [Prevotellaceae bacterium]|jgi:hypothetical protein|nr:T9SS type A sorting domain-containing protein [Prevotellaceae bacterium]
MKKTFKLLAIFMCSIVFINLPTVAHADGDGDSIDPPIFPSPCVECVAVYQAVSSIEVVFFEEAEASVEVVTENGNPVYQTNGTVEKDSQVSINTDRLNRGKYTVRVRLNGQLVKQQIINVD